MTGKQVGRVCLVGAGPGDPGLITVKGLERLRAAEVIVYDALANAALLEHAPVQAELIDVGKRAGDHKMTQQQINDLLIEKAQQGRFVVRLKGGDPYLFGRGAEEAIALGKAGIECEVVSGVTAGIAAAAAAGVPVTHRKIASTVTFVTGHEEPGKSGSAVDYAALAKLISAGGTVCFYMGMSRLGEITEALMKNALAPDTPLALVQWGTLPRQRQLRTNLKQAAVDATAAQIGSPAIIIVGKVAALDEPALNWFISRPLMGRRIVITRTRNQASELRRQLQDLGAEVLEAPTVEIDPIADYSAVDAALKRAGEYDWLVLTSANGVDVLAQRLELAGLDSRHLAEVNIAVVGEATAARLLQKLNIRADLVPSRFIAEELASELVQRAGAKGKRMLLLRGDIGREILPELLRKAGAAVDDLDVYHSRIAAQLPEMVLNALRRGEVDWISFTSSSQVQNMVQLLGEQGELLKAVKIASIGPITSGTIRELNLPVNAEAEQASIHSLVKAIVQHAQQSGR